MRSHDPHTQTWARLITADGLVIEGANCMAPGVELTWERLQRPEKYDWIEHAERVVLLRAAARGVATAGARLEMGWYPCAPCARAIAWAEVGELVCDAYPGPDDRYRFEVARQKLAEAGVRVTEWPL